jgi:hypothetical protein
MNSTIWLITAPDKLVTILSASAWQALTKKNHVLYIRNDNLIIVPGKE